jgi:hypothetical protein
LDLFRIETWELTDRRVGVLILIDPQTDRDKVLQILSKVAARIERDKDALGWRGAWDEEIWLPETAAWYRDTYYEIKSEADLEALVRQAEEDRRARAAADPSGGTPE